MRAGTGDLRRQVSDLTAKLRALSKRVSTVSVMASAADTGFRDSAKRFRIGSFTTPLIALGGTVTGTVRWSAPMTTADYYVDATIPAVGTTVWTYMVTNRTADGCTIQFSAPVLLSLGTIVIVVGVSPAPTS